MHVFLVTAKRQRSNSWYNLVVSAKDKDDALIEVKAYATRNGIRFDVVKIFQCYESGYPIQFVGVENDHGIPVGMSTFSELRD